MANAEARDEGFQIPNEIINRDVCEYATNGYDLQQFAARRIAISAGDRLGPFTTLAIDDMSLLVAPDFLQNNSMSIRPPLRPKYTTTKSAVNRLIYTNFYIKGLAILVPYTELAKGRDWNRVHFSPLSWAPNFGTPKRRPISDCSYGGYGGVPLELSIHEGRVRCYLGNDISPNDRELRQYDRSICISTPRARRSG
jgi:hypothetical protein